MTKKTASKKTAAKTKASLKNKPSGKKAKPAARVQAVSKKTAVAPKKAPKKILKPEKKPAKAVEKAVKKPVKKPAPKAAKPTNEPKRKPAKNPIAKKPAPAKCAKKPTAQKKSAPLKKTVKQEKKISPKKVQPAPQKSKAENSKKVKPEAKQPAKKAEPSKPAPEKPAKTKVEKTAAVKPLVKDVKGKKKHERPSHNIYFSIDDLDAYFEHKETSVSHHSKEISEKSTGQNSKAAKASAAVQVSKKPLAVATVFDILGLNPVIADTHEKLEEHDVPRKWRKYYKLLVDLRRHHSSGVEMRSEEVLKRSAKEDAGDLSSYGQHLADAGSESFERDMAYNLISNQKEILAEIDEAIKRIKNGTYGICEVTGKPIPESRLTSIPYTRCTKEGQEIKEREARKQKSAQRGAAVYEMPSEQGGGEEDASA